MSGVLRWSEEHLRQHQAKRAAECAKADGREASDSVAEVIPYGTSIKPPKPRDLLGDRLPALLESDVLPSILAALRVHPKVAVAVRMNSGAMKVDDRYVQFGFPGCPDLWAMLKGGQTLWIECKRVGKKPTDEQAAFMALINRHGGRAFTAFGVTDIFRELDMNRD